MNGYVQKIVKKSAYWHRHGRRKVPLHERLVVQQPRLDRTEWFSSVGEAFAAYKRRKGH